MKWLITILLFVSCATGKPQRVYLPVVRTEPHYLPLVIKPETPAVTNIYFVNSTVNSTDGAVASCQIQNNGATLGNCVNTGASTSAFNTPQGIVIYNDYAYITNNGSGNVYPNNSITKCQISSPGQLSGCTQVASTTTFSVLTGISIYL